FLSATACRRRPRPSWKSAAFCTFICTSPTATGSRDRYHDPACFPAGAGFAGNAAGDSLGGHGAVVSVADDGCGQERVDSPVVHPRLGAAHRALAASALDCDLRLPVAVRAVAGLVELPRALEPSGLDR